MIQLFPFQIQPQNSYIKFLSFLSFVKAENISDAFVQVQLNHQNFGLVIPYAPLPLDWFQQQPQQESVQSVPTQQAPEILPEQRKRAFINNLKLAADEYCLTPEDAQTVRSIAERIEATLS